MFAIEQRAGFLNEMVRAIYTIGRAFASAIPAEPAPYWTEYLHETRDHRS